MAKPFVKWVGGKRQLLPFLLPKVPRNFHRYYEPFAGGGAMFFSLTPRTATLSDICCPLIVAYRCIQKDPKRVLEELRQLNDALQTGERSVYYEVRKDFNAAMHGPKKPFRIAAQMLFLNRHAFNGLWRVNQRGEFNAPFNGNFRKGFQEQDILDASYALQGVRILEQDFSFVEQEAQAGDFVFLDSPYVPLLGGSFTAYHSSGFTMEDHVRLAELFQTLTRRGVYCLATNHNTLLVRELYQGFPMTVVPAKRMINCKADQRTGEEIIIQNY